MSQLDETGSAINAMIKKGRTMESGTMIINGRTFEYKFRLITPKNQKEWEDGFRQHEKGEYLPNHTKCEPISPLGRCDLCKAPIYEQSDAELNGYCWNCGVKFT